MGRKRVARDPVGDIGTDPRSVGEFVELLREVLDSLPTDQREVLIALANNLTLSEFAGFRSIPIQQVRQSRTRGLASLRAAAADPRVAQYQDLSLSRALLAVVREEFALRFPTEELAYVGAGSVTEETKFFSCDSRTTKCMECGHNLVPALARGDDGRGRRRIFCSNACRQRAYRRRRAMQQISDADLAAMASVSNAMRI
ncbi:RNA polymerase sigma factor sigma-70 region 4 domain-containing protein [Nocardia salmonicida]|uniref:hypothetical protein n=1 Tax=Nocardia salmonicida TaxID=53431 RepID=UPI0007A40713|nr:hypothetical protein [Nocardia salmonicida]